MRTAPKLKENRPACNGEKSKTKVEERPHRGGQRSMAHTPKRSHIAKYGTWEKRRNSQKARTEEKEKRTEKDNETWQQQTKTQ